MMATPFSQSCHFSRIDGTMYTKKKRRRSIPTWYDTTSVTFVGVEIQKEDLTITSYSGPTNEIETHCLDRSPTDSGVPRRGMSVKKPILESN